MTSWRDVVCDSRCMTGTCDTFKILSFSVMQSTFRFSNVEILAVPTTSLYLPTFFSVKCVRFFDFTESEFPKIYRRLPKVAKDFGWLPKIAEGFQRLPKISRRLPTITEGVEGFSTTSKQGWPRFSCLSLQFACYFLSSYDVHKQLSPIVHRSPPRRGSLHERE